MSILKRFHRLFKADTHALLDDLEHPDSQLKQAMREMSEKIEHLREYVEIIEEQQHRITMSLAQLKEKSAIIDDDITLCLQKDDQMLASHAVEKKLLLQQKVEQLNSKLASISFDHANALQQLDGWRKQYSHIEQQLQIIQVASGADQSHEKAQDNESISAKDIEIALLNEMALRGYER